MACCKYPPHCQFWLALLQEYAIFVHIFLNHFIMHLFKQTLLLASVALVSVMSCKKGTNADTPDVQITGKLLLKDSTYTVTYGTHMLKSTYGGVVGRTYLLKSDYVTLSNYEDKNVVIIAKKTDHPGTGPDLYNVISLSQ